MKKIGVSSYISDERGNINLKTNAANSEEIFRGSDVGKFNTGENAESGSLPIDDCLSNLALCSDGLSIAFALRGKYFSQISPTFVD